MKKVKESIRIVYEQSLNEMCDTMVSNYIWTHVKEEVNIVWFRVRMPIEVISFGDCE